MSRIFLSHSSKDLFEAIAVRDWLKEEGWDDVFLDADPERGINPGERWERALHQAAQRCEAVVFLLSRHWLASGWCRREYELARSHNKQLFGVVIDPDMKIGEAAPELTGTWQVVSLVAGQDGCSFRIKPAGSHEERHVTFGADGLRRLKRGLEKAGLDQKFFAWPPEAEAGRVPYRGLKPLEAADAGIFFGRDAPIVEGIDTLRALAGAAPPRLLVILGASGAGKSSFLRAGLLPRLARDDAHFLPLPPIRPERAALTGEAGLFAALAAAMPGRSRAEWRKLVGEGAAAIKPLLADLVHAVYRQTLADGEARKRPAIVIAIDQAEELFRPAGAEEGAALLAILRDLTIGEDPAVIVVFVIRSDSYDALEHAKPLEGLRQVPLALLPMPRGAYKEVIEGPARRLAEAGGKLAIEPQLTARLLTDIEQGGGSDALPLLAFTLEQLTLEYGGAGALRLADYEAFGGLKGAIDKAVERAFAKADADPRIPRDRAERENLLRRGLVPWLAGIDPISKSPRRAIARASDIPPEAAPLIELLVEERLLTTDTKPEIDPATGAEVRIKTIEPAHEALLRQWGLLDGWLKEDFGLLATLEAVQRAARDWDANARAPAWLAHQGQRLADAGALDARPDIAAKLDAVDRAYLAACRGRDEAARTEAEERRREKEAEEARKLKDAEALAAANKSAADANRRTAQRTGFGLLAALVLAGAALVFGIYAKSQKHLADQKTQEAQAQRDRAEGAVSTFMLRMMKSSRGLQTDRIELDEIIKQNPTDASNYVLRGLSLSQSGKFSAALNDANKSIQLNPRFLFGYYIKAMIFEKREDFESAAEFLNHTVEMDPNNSWITSALVSSLVEKNDLNGAITLLAIMVRSVSDEKRKERLLLEQGELYQKIKMYAEAINNYTKLLETHNSHALLYKRGNCHYMLNNYDLAIRDLTLAVAMKGSFSSYHNMLGNAFDGKGDFDLALSSYTQAISIDQYAVYYYNRSFTYQKINKRKQAIADLDRAIEIDPEDVDYFRSRSLLLKEIEEFDRSASDASVVISREKSNAELCRDYERRGDVFFAAKKYDDAYADYTKAVELNPSFYEGNLRRANVLRAKKSFDAALNLLRKTVQSTPLLEKNYKVQEDIAQVLLKLNRTQEALKYADRVVELAAAYVDGLVGRAVIYRRLGYYQKAMVDVNRSLQLDPSHLYARYTRGGLYRSLGDLVRAEADYFDVSKASSQSVFGRAASCWLKLKNEEPSAALTFCDEVIKQRHEDAGLVTSRGIILLKLARFDDAEKDFSRALQIDPLLGEARYGLSMAKSQSNRISLDTERAPDNTYKASFAVYLRN